MPKGQERAWVRSSLSQGDHGQVTERLLGLWFLQLDLSWGGRLRSTVGRCPGEPGLSHTYNPVGEVLPSPCFADKPVDSVVGSVLPEPCSCNKLDLVFQVRRGPTRARTGLAHCCYVPRAENGLGAY